MVPKKITVHFQDVRVAVPCHPEMLVVELIDAASQRYEKITHQQGVRVHFLQCLSDDGILIPDDRLFDVFDENSDQILAIYDEPDLNFSTPQNNGHDRPLFNNGMRNSATVIKVKNGMQNSKRGSKSDEDEIIEVVSFSDPPINVDGLRVVSDTDHSSQPSSSVHSQFSATEQPESRESLRSNLHKPTSGHKVTKSVTYSPDVFKRTIPSNKTDSPLTSENSSSTNLSRTTARKSMITDAFLDAKERLEERLNKSLSIAPENMKSFEVALSLDSVGQPLGIEISAVPDPNDSKGHRLLAVEIIRIDEDGRIARDGRIKVGDQITHINDRPVYQMSLARARAYLHELKTIEEPKLTLERQQSSVMTNSNSELASMNIRPIVTPLQQANTTQIGNTFTVKITKGRQGFGFGISGRVTAKNEHLFIVSSVKLDSPANGLLKIGDRLLQINDQPLADLEQSEVTNKLKSFKEGETISILASRITTENGTAKEDSPNVSRENHNMLSAANDSNMDSSMRSIRAEVDENCETLLFDIPLNDSPSAGLGISLKAQKIYKDGLAIDCGLYINKVLQGSAAFRDGRLKKDDRLIGIEDVDLRYYAKNGEALQAFMRTMSSLSPTVSSVKVYVARKRAIEDRKETFVVNRAVFPPSPHIEVPQGHLAREDREERLTKSEDESDTASVIPEEPFARDKFGRKSMSEKRLISVSNDPFHTPTFLKIKHQRQTSAPLIANENAIEEPLIIRRSLGGRRAASLSKHRFTLAPETIRLDDEAKKVGEKPQSMDNSPMEKSKISKTSAKIEKDTKPTNGSTKPCLTRQENIVTSTSIFSSLLHLGRKNKKGRRQSLLYDINLPEDEVGKENKIQLVKASPKRRSVSLDPVAANKVNENQIPQLPPSSNVIIDPLSHKNRPKVYPAPSFKAAMTNSESQPVISGALLKLFRSREGSPEKSHLRFGDEEEAFRRNLENERLRNYAENLVFQGVQGSPSQMRRHPPPPYRSDPRAAFPPPPPPPPHFHQRMYSANEISTPKKILPNNSKHAFTNLQCDEKDLLKNRFKPPEFASGATMGRTRFYVTSDIVTPVDEYPPASRPFRSFTLATAEGRMTRQFIQQEEPPSSQPPSSLMIAKELRQNRIKTRSSTAESSSREATPTTTMPSTRGLPTAAESALASPRSPRRPPPPYPPPTPADLRSQPSTPLIARRHIPIPIAHTTPENEAKIRTSETLQLQLDNRRQHPQLVKPTAIRLHRVPPPESPLEIKPWFSPNSSSPSTDSNQFPANKPRKFSELVQLEQNDRIQITPRPRAQSTMTPAKSKKIFPVFPWSAKQNSRFGASPVRKSINRRSTPSAVFYDDSEPPVHC